MREILFRGKDIANNWHYGFPLVFTEDYVCITAPHTYNKKVETNTLGQYTGLTDKNGKKIFEGDILEYRKEKFVVVFQEGAFCHYYLRDYAMKTGSPAAFNDVDYYLDTDESEIIGNIHDNPELFSNLQSSKQ